MLVNLKQIENIQNIKPKTGKIFISCARIFKQTGYKCNNKTLDFDTGKFILLLTILNFTSILYC